PMAAGTFLTVPTVVGRHDGTHTGLNGRDVPLHVDASQGGFVDAGVALVDRRAGSPGGPAITDKVLGARKYGEGIPQIVGLEPSYGGGGHGLHHVRRFSEALISAAPALVLRRRNARRENPIDPAGPHFLGDGVF